MVDNMNKAWNNSSSVSMSNVFDIFESPNYYESLEYSLEDEIVKHALNRIHLKELLTKLIDTFGIAYKYSEYIDKLNELSKVKENLFDNYVPKLKIIREYKNKYRKRT